MWQKLERQVQAFLQPLAAAGLFGPPGEPGAFQVVCDERVNGPEDVAAGRVNLLVSLRTARPGAIPVVHGDALARRQPRAAGALRAAAGEHAHDASRPRSWRTAATDTQRQRTLAQALFGHYREPRPPPSVVAPHRTPVPPAAGRLDPETIARIHRDFGRRLQRF